MKEAKSRKLVFTFITVIGFVIFVFPLKNLQARNRLEIPYIGAWDFNITNFKLSESRVNLGNPIYIQVGVRKLVSSDNTGIVKINLSISLDGRVIHTEGKVLDIGYRKNYEEASFVFKPNRPGSYNVSASVTGGTGFTWTFDSIRPGDGRTEFIVIGAEAPKGFRLLPVEEQGRYSVYTFEFAPGTVNELADDWMACDHYARQMILQMSFKKFNVDEAILLALPPAIILTANNLHSYSKQHRSETIYYQLKFDNNLSRGIEVAQIIKDALELARFWGEISPSLPYGR